METSAALFYPELGRSRLAEMGRDSALRCPRPRPAGGTNGARTSLYTPHVPRLNGAGTAQRAIPTILPLSFELLLSFDL